MVGYQGVFFLFNSQVQWGLFDNIKNVLQPKAPDKWAIEVSIEITRSKFLIIAAVSKNGASLSNFFPKFLISKFRL